MAANLLAGEILYPRYPALSPDGKTIAFTYQGDIWTVSAEGGTARRLTIHEAEDIRPQFSGDGKKILFSSRRDNNYDVFVIPAEGGVPTQLTFHSSSDIGTSWFAQGDSIVFTSNRDGWRDIYKTSVKGGTPILLTGYPYEQEYNGRIVSNGRYLLYNNGSGLSRWWRRDLQASRNADIFLADRTQDQFSSRRLTDFSGHDVWPVFNETENEFYFVSCRGEWAQVWKKAIDGGPAAAMTNFVGDGVQWLNSNPQGTMLVFEQDFKLWLLNPAEGQPRPIPVQIDSDERVNLIEKKTFNGNVDWFSLSPDEQKIAAIIHGEIFVFPAEEPVEGIRLTNSSTREQHPVWGKDSRSIYYASDRNGNYDIYSADVTTGVEIRLTDAPENEVKPLVSPDGNHLVCYRGLDKLIRINLENAKESEWVTGMFFDLGVEPTMEYAWSPDSKWLVFTMAGATYETDIFVTDLDGNVHNLSNFSDWNFRPRFANDGKSAYFTSTVNDRYETFKIDLVAEPFEFYESSFDSLFIEDKKEDEDKKDNGKEDKVEEEIPTVVIDFDRIEKRRVKAYDLSSSSTYPVLTPDGEKFVFVASIMGKPEIWSVNTEDDPELEQITKSGKSKKLLTVTENSEDVFYLEGGKIKKSEIDGGETTTLSIKAVMGVDIQKLNHQKFAETWQTLNTYFYDSDFHGTDWQAMREKYEPLVDHIRTEEEFRNLLKELMGELRASHLNAYSRLPRPNGSIKTGRTGIVLDHKTLDREGSFRINRIIPESPAALAGIEAGQYILGINGEELTSQTNFFARLAGTIDHRLTLTLGDQPNKKGRDIDLKPNDNIGSKVYDEWVENRRRLVDSLSGGRLAYIHIRAMSGSQLEAFKQKLVSIAEHKEGLLIDVRNNGGGSIAVHLLGILVKTPYFLRNFRDFPTTSENKMRSKSLEKPMALLINNYSASNSEIFAEGFRTLKLGKIIGEPTAGAVIGTSSYYLIDGSRIRRPSWGAFTVDMEDTDIKRRYPDIMVENLPDDFINGRDPQLVRAVEELLKELPQ
ncbi:MAG: hypothetical protein GY841_14515 [FCB group bacterium]|nr:hypothetical protein [FCB group bacterium]